MTIPKGISVSMRVSKYRQKDIVQIQCKGLARLSLLQITMLIKGKFLSPGTTPLFPRQR
jgi:hypothetical protein